jgi:hypothetical protein
MPRGTAGVGEGAVTLSASVRSGARCRAAQPAWKGGRRGLSAEWRGGVERWAGRSTPIGGTPAGTAGACTDWWRRTRRSARRGLGTRTTPATWAAERGERGRLLRGPGGCGLRVAPGGSGRWVSNGFGPLGKEIEFGISFNPIHYTQKED